MTMRLAMKSRIHHKVEMGILFDAFYDTETTDLNKRFAEITQFGGVVTDLAGNVLHMLELRGRVSPYTVVSPYAWLIQRMRAEDTERGDPRYIFAGKMLRFFRHAGSPAEAPYAETFLSLCRKETVRDENGKEKTYYAYPVLNDDMSVDWDYLRIDANLTTFYFRRPGEERWIRRDIKAMTTGYNNVNADDQWIWSAAHMAAAENIFPTHLAQTGKYRLDGLRAAEAAVIAGSGGENGVRAGVRTDTQAGPSFSQEALLAANTRLEAERRGILEGVTLPDGSRPDPERAHGALFDALSLAALMRFMREREPDILRQMETNSDWKSVVSRLSESEGGFGSNPVLAYIDKSFPVIDGKMVTLIGTDQYRNNPKVALVYNLGVDPKTYRYNGKALGDLSAQDWAQIIRAAKRDPNAPVKVIKTHHSPRLLDAKTGYEKGFNLGIERSELSARVRHLVREGIAERAMEGLRLAYPRLHGPERLILPQPEEELFTFSTLELYDEASGEDVQVSNRFQNKIEEMAQKSRAHAMTVKALWLAAMQPDEDILLDDVPQPGAAAAFTDRMKEISKKLAREGGAPLPQPDAPVTDRRSAMDWKIKILFFARDYFQRGLLQDIGHHFWFEDADGLKIPESEVAAWSSAQIDEARHSGNLTIRHEETQTMVLVIDRIIEDLGHGALLGPAIAAQLDAYKALRQAGMTAGGREDRWYTAARGHSDLEAIEGNEIPDEDLRAIEGLAPGAWDLFASRHHDSRAALADYRAYLGRLRTAPLSPQERRLVGLDPATGYPVRNREYEVNPRTALVIDVPDRYLTDPPIDPASRRPLWLVPLSAAFNREALAQGRPLLLRAAQTGRLFHLARARETALPPRGGAYEEFYRAAAARYAESGAAFPAGEAIAALRGNGPYPLHDLSPTPAGAQSLKIPQRLFEGMLAPALASYRVRPRGTILRDEALELAPGPVRLIEAAGKAMTPTGWEAATTIETVQRIGLSDVETMPEARLHALGFSSREEALDRFTALFADHGEDPRDPDNKVLAVMFRRPARKGALSYRNPAEEVVSCIAAPQP